ASSSATWVPPPTTRSGFPPPRPPSRAAPGATRSWADTPRCTRSRETATTRFAFPSSAVPRATTAEASRSRRVMASLRSSSTERPSRFRTTSFADPTGVVHVRAAAELLGVVPHLDHAHVVAVLLAEQRHRPEGGRLVVGRFEGVDGVVGEHSPVDLLLDAGEGLGPHGLEVLEVEA